jgi:hypothetical protein
MQLRLLSCYVHADALSVAVLLLLLLLCYVQAAMAKDQAAGHSLVLWYWNGD